jgi:hypothetical protein
MTSVLANIRKGIRIAPPTALLYGVPGIGKSSFAAGAKDVIFVTTEEGVNNLNTSSFPVAKTFVEFMTNLYALATEEHEYKAVAIDSLDWLEKLIWQHTVEEAKSEKIKNIEDFGYSKGQLFALTHWQQFLDLAAKVRNQKGIPIILVAHCNIKRFDSPETEPYDRYQPKLDKHASALVVEWCENVLFTNYKAFTAKTDVGFQKSVRRAVGTGERVMYTSERPAYIAKNRYKSPARASLVLGRFHQRRRRFRCVGTNQRKKKD